MCISNYFVRLNKFFVPDIFIHELFFFIVRASSCNSLLGALDLVAGVERPFDHLVIQNHQAMHSVGTCMD